MRISDWSSDVCSSDLYRFFFNPIRYTSLGLAVLEAMMAGLPVVGLATTETATLVENGVNGYEIERESWQERVGQYVWISVVVESLNKQAKNYNNTQQEAYIEHHYLRT